MKSYPIGGDAGKYRDAVHALAQIQSPWDFWARMLGIAPVIIVAPVAAWSFGTIGDHTFVVLLTGSILILLAVLVTFYRFTNKLMAGHAEAVGWMPLDIEDDDGEGMT
jgi:hypothetical protein